MQLQELCLHAATFPPTGTLYVHHDHEGSRAAGVLYDDEGNGYAGTQQGVI